MNNLAVVLKFRKRPPRKPKAQSRPRNHLWEPEVERLISACHGVNEVRNQTIILMMFRHGLREVEATRLLWSDIYWERREIYIRRVKGSDHSTHPLSDREVSLLKRLPRSSKFVFSHGDLPLSTRSIRHIVAECGKRAEIGFQVNAHALRHSCGAHLSSSGADLRVIQVYLGHRNVNHTSHYVALSANRFQNHYWRD